ncbi:5212_t:CDS:2 [Dentiscutata erythropus]|uniref:5212_t:CDS:1 n=1 Tax=Dentiscutata erythropus TaxID=1348616 RepID=A0A9N9H4R0_9GLOM|nr:5212_t:CDS:2 [Dentiscutata erythropus]
MPRPNAKSRIASSKTRNKAGVFVANPKDINDIEENMNILEDWELFEITHDSFQNYALKTIEWHEKADKKLKFTFYTGNSRTNLWKKRKAQEQLQHEAKQMRTLDEMWSIKARDKGKAPALSYREDILAQSKRQMQRIEECYNELKNQLRSLQNAKKNLAKSQPYEVQRLTSIFHYYRLLLDGEKKISASEKIGKHAKRESLLDDEDLKLAACTWLRSILPKDHSSLALKKELETNIFSKLLGVYFNGHEWEDVREYQRLEIWDMRHVLVTHDEVYFYANDDNSSFWVEDKESIIKKKGQGLAIMPGQQADSYWKSENMVKQLREKAIPIFNALHPGCIGIVSNSTNHNVYALDALVCSRMTMHPKVENKFKFKDGWFIRNYEKITQPMFFLDEDDDSGRTEDVDRSEIGL